MVYNLCQELVRLGHEVTLFASGDSRTKARLIPTYPHAVRTLKRAQNFMVRNSMNVSGVGRVAAYLRDHPREFDIIHNHIGWMFLPFVDFLSTPVVTTFHGFLRNPVESEIYRNYRSHNFVSISRSQQRFVRGKLNFVANVYNGIDVGKFRFNARPKDYCTFFARFSPEKGPLEAIHIAQQSGVRLVMAGKVDPVDSDYFKRKIMPHIDGRQISFIGELGHREKERLLRNARALIAPIQWEEPFGLYYAEAMACGTPVITFRRGSAPEIVKDRQTGFLVKTVEEAVRRIPRLGEIRRQACRRRAERCFGHDRMARGYLEVYESLIRAKKE